MATREDPALLAIVESIRRLSPEQRRRLLRRLRAVGLLSDEELASDRNRLGVSPALGTNHPMLRRRKRKAAPVEPPAAPSVPAPIPAEPPPAEPAPAEYRSPVRGKVVVGSPTNAPADLDPHAMTPLPGMAPEQQIVIIFDGGSRGNPGQGYGSYAVRWPGLPQQVIQLRFGDKVTNNEAEYDTLIAALEATLARLRDSGAAASSAKLEIRGDSLLVVNQVLGKWESKDARMAMRRDRVRNLLNNFGAWRLLHHDREHSVKTLGH